MTTRPKTAVALDAACLTYARAKAQVDGEHMTRDALKRRVEARKAAVEKLFKAAEARAQELTEDDDATTAG